MNSAEPRDQVKPHCTVGFEVGELFRIDLVAQITGDHPVVLQLQVAWPSLYLARWARARPSPFPLERDRARRFGDADLRL